MKNTFGNVVTVTLFGESHGPMIGAVLDGLAPGLEVSEEYIREKLAMRRPAGAISTARVEMDPYQIVSGVFEGKTTGTPLCILIPNENVDSRNYDKNRFVARPGHADYTNWCKYHGFEDYRGGGHSSGRITAALVAAGAILMHALEKKGICIETRTRNFDEQEILAAKADGDSVGGILETEVTGLPAGLGEPWFDTVEGLLSHMLFSIPAVKGVVFGDAVEMACGRGSDYNDSFYAQDGQIGTRTNHNGGVNGGITNGMPVRFRTYMKPTPSIAKPQETVDFRNMENVTLSIEGRHDPAIVHRARVVVDCVTAIALADLISLRFGTDELARL